MTTTDPSPPEVNVTAAAARIRLWLELYPDTVNVAPEIGISQGFISDSWPYKFYAIDRRDLEAVLSAVTEKES